MAETRTNLGIVLPGFAGAYDPERTYTFYEFVRDGNDTFIAKKESKGIPTDQEAYWYRVTKIGKTPSIAVDSVVTLPPGDSARVVNVGDDTEAVFRFEIPAGLPGQDGDGSGDMTRASYDVNENGIVDDAEKLGGKEPSYYATAQALSAKADQNHTHSEYAEASSLQEGAFSAFGTGENDMARGNHTHAGYLAEETDPTVPAWAKAAQKPAYTAGEVGAVPVETTINGKPLRGSIELTAADVQAVPSTRKLNGKPLSADIALTAGDVGALPLTGGALTGELVAASPAPTVSAVRNIYAGTADMVSGTTALATGVIYLVYS